MMRRAVVRLMVLACALAGAVAGSAQAPAIDAELLKADTAYLSSDALSGRLPGTQGATKTVGYMIQQMKAAGLTPGYRGHWIQDVPLVTITPDPATSLSVAGRDGRLTLRQSVDAIMWTKEAVSRLSIDATPLVFVGYGINAPERGWNDYAGADVRGKIVIILVNDPDWQSSSDDGIFGGRRLTYYGRYTYKFEEAARQGAAGALIVHETAAAGYPFQVLVNTNAGPKIDLDVAATATEHAPLEGWLSSDAASRLFQLSGHDLAALTRSAQMPGFRAVPLDLTAATTINTHVTRSTSQNVIGMIRGRSRPGEAFLYSAHWDHLGRCPPVAGGHAICNGAIDNASGSAGLLALARAFRTGPRPERSILFLSLTGEEQGLLGSAFYVKAPAIPIAKTAGGINIDVMNVFGPTRDVMILHPGLTSLEPLFVKAAAQQGRRLSPEMMPNQGLYYRSDQLSFARAGIPFLFASSGLDRGPGVPLSLGLAGYFQHVYHSAGDVFDPRWNWEGAIQDLSLYYTVGANVANSDDWPSWSSGAEFRRTPDASVKGS